MENNVQMLTGKVVALAIIVLMIASVAIPTISSATDSSITIEKQNATARYFAANDGTSVSITITNDGAGNIAINGYAVTVAHSFVLACENAVIRTQNNGSTLGLRVTDLESVSDLAVEATGNITVSNGVMTYTANNTERTVTLQGQIMYLAENGNYGLYPPSSTVNIDKDATIYIYRDYYGLDNVNGVFISASGKISNISVHEAVIRSNNVYADLTDPSIVVNYTDEDLNKGGFSVKVDTSTMITLSFTWDGTEHTGPAVFNGGYFAPINYKVTDTDSSMYALIGIIPILLIIVAVLFAVRMIGGSRN